MSVPKKIFVCFLFSVFLFAGIAVFVFTGMFGLIESRFYSSAATVLMLIAAFLTLFLIVFFCFNLRRRRGSASEVPSFAETNEKKIEIPDNMPQVSSASETGYEKPEELDVAVDSPEQKTISVNPLKDSNVRLVSGDDDISCLAESGGIELVDGDVNKIASFMEDTKPANMEKREEDTELEDEAAELDDISTGFDGSISLFRQPFAFFMGNPELLQEAGNQDLEFSGEMIYEQDGIHYINSNFDNDIERELDSDFVKLVESVVRK